MKYKWKEWLAERQQNESNLLGPAFTQQQQAVQQQPAQQQASTADTSHLLGPAFRQQQQQGNQPAQVAPAAMTAQQQARRKKLLGPLFSNPQAAMAQRPTFFQQQAGPGA